MDEQYDDRLPTTETESEALPATAEEDHSSPTPAESGLTVVFNRSPRHLSADEAVRYAQQGLKWEQFAPQYRKLQAVSKRLGSSVGGVIDGLLGRMEQEEWEALSAAHPDDLLQAAQLFAAAQQERTQQWEQAPAMPTDEERWAAEYEALCAEVPDAPSPAALPAEVFTVAQQEAIPLLDAYLRVQYREQRRVAEAAQAAETAAARSAGSLRGETDNPDTAGEAFWRALTHAL